MRQTKRFACLVAVSLLMTAFPLRASGQRIPIRIFRPPAPRPVYHPPVRTPIVEKPFTTLEITRPFPTSGLQPSLPSRLSRIASGRQIYTPGYPTSETDLEVLIQQLRADPLASTSDIWLREYLRLRAAIKLEESKAEALKEEIKQNQKRLKGLGYYSSSIDGIEGPQTKEAVSRFLDDNFPDVPVHRLGEATESDFANPQIKSLIAVSYDLSVSARIVHRLDREQRLAVINRSRSILGFADEVESTDIYIGSNQLQEIEETGGYVIKDREKGTSVKVPTQPANLIVVRYYPKGDRKKFEILTGTKATAHFFEHVINKVDQPGENRIALVPIGKEAYVVTGDAIFRLSPQEVASLKRGIALKEPNPLASEITRAQDKPLVIFNHPLSQKNKGMRQTIGQLAFGLQRSYPQTRIVRSDFSAGNTLENISALMNHEIKAPEEVVVVIDRSSDRVKTFGAVENSRSKLQASGVQIVDYMPGTKWAGGEKKSVIVITGHISSRLAKLIEELCKDGYFAGNFVVFNSCYELTGLSTRVVEALRHRCGALAVFRFNTAIHPRKVTTFLDGVANTLTPRQPISLFDLIYRNLPPSMSGGWEAYNWHNATKDDHDVGN